MSDTYQPFGDSKEEYELAPPTNARMKRLIRSELKADLGQTSAEAEVARTFGWEPAQVVPGYTGDGGEENDVEAISFPEHMADAVEICLEGADPDGREGDVRVDEASRAKADFMRRATAINGATGR